VAQLHLRLMRAGCSLFVRLSLIGSPSITQLSEASDGKYVLVSTDKRWGRAEARVKIGSGTKRASSRHISDQELEAKPTGPQAWFVGSGVPYVVIGCAYTPSVPGRWQAYPISHPERGNHSRTDGVSRLHLRSL